MYVYSERHMIDPSTGRVIELLTAEQYDEMHSIQSEQAAELKNAQYFENLGYEEALGQEQFERDRGVISFEDAFAHSLGYLDAAEREATEAHGLFT